MIINIIVITLTVLCLLIMYKMAVYLIDVKTKSKIYNTVPFKKFIYSKQYNELKSGDILYTISAIFTDCGFVYPEIYKHVLLIIEKDNKLYTVESTPPTIIGKHNDKLVIGKDIVQYPLEDRLKYELSLIYICRLNKKLTTTLNNSLIQNLSLMKDYKYPTIISLFRKFILDIPDKSNTYVCYDLVYMLLKSIGLLPDRYHNLSTKEIAKFITHIEGKELNNGYTYEPTKQLIYDIDD